MKFFTILSAVILPALALAEGEGEDVDVTTTCTSTMVMTKTVTLINEHTTSVYLNSTSAGYGKPSYKPTGTGVVTPPAETTTDLATVPTGAAPALAAQGLAAGVAGLLVVAFL